MCMMYTRTMLRINTYIPEDLNKKLDFIAKFERKAKAEVIREALEVGLKKIQAKSSTAQALLDFAKKAEQVPTKGSIPEDFIGNLDYYTWGDRKRE